MLLLLLAACRLATPAEPPLPFVEADPPGGGRAPLVVAIHGLGDVPNSLITVVQRCRLPVRIVAPRGLNAHGRGWSWFDGVEAEPIAHAADRVAELLAHLARRDDVVGKPVVTGFSQGGFLAFALAVRHPDAVAAAIPIAGGLPSELEPDTAPATAPPIRALHGDADRVVPLAPTREMVHRLESRGWDARLRVFPRVAHSVPEAVHAELCRQLASVVE